jgi:hypothetical protein
MTRNISKKFLLLLTILLLFVSSLSILNIKSINTQAATGDWQEKGINVQSNYAEDFASENFKQSMRKAYEAGIRTAVLVVSYSQSNFYADDLKPGYNTPSDSALQVAITYLKAIGITPSIKVFAESPDGWRAYMNPSNRDAWFTNYNNILTKYAKIAEANGLKLFCIGTEMIKLTSSAENPDNTRRWKGMIANLRKVYSGKLTYSAQFDRDWWNEIDNIGFFDDLDTISISAYYILTKSTNPSIEELKTAWAKTEARDILPLYNKYKKPITFTEFGYKSMDRAFEVPGDWAINSGYNENNQANGFEAFFQYFSNKPYFNGVHIWDWSTNPNAGGYGNTDYTPQNKKTETVIKKYFGNSAVAVTSSTSLSSSTSSTSTNTNPNPSIKTFGLSASQSGNNLLVNVVNNSTTNYTGLNLSVEIYNSNNQRVSQIVYSGANYKAGEKETLTTDLNKLPKTAGKYTIKVGIFNTNWTIAHTWEEVAGEYTIKENTTNTTNTTQVPGKIEIWWPSNGSAITGVQPFKAIVSGMKLTDYKMFWQVDGGQMIEMYDSNEGYAHKESWVDLSNWKWQGTNAYTLNFVAKDKAGVTIQTQTTKIYVK